MEDMCTGCLSTDRKLFFIVETGYYHLYSQILNEIPVYDLSQICLRVCWECRARLRGFLLFKQQIKRNYCNLMQHIPSQPTLKLSSQSAIVFSYPEIPPEPEDELKCELTVKTEEHCEPEPFASALNVEHTNIEKKDVPPKKKKKPKIKLKSTKIKVKKKRKKSDNDVKVDVKVDIGINEDFDSDIEDGIDNIDGNTDVEDNAQNIKNLNDTAKEDSENTKLKEVTEDKKVIKRTRNSSPLPERPQCQECGKVFSSKKTYRYHLNVLHKGQNRYPCPRCGKVYQWKSNLGRHLRSHRAVDDGELHCELCDKSFASVATYRQHLRISRRHVPEAEFSFACEACGKRFVNKTRLRDHIDWDHLKQIKFRCQLCDKPFKCHTSLYVHTQNVHIAKEKKENLCHVCGKSYQNAAKLKYHITAMHSGETPHRCTACGAAFGWYSSLYRHMREVHYKMKGGTKKNKKVKLARGSTPTEPQYEPL